MKTEALKALAVMAALVCLSGCVVYDEHVTLDKDGGVKADIQINKQALGQASPEFTDPTVLKMMLGRSRPATVDLSIEKAGENLRFVFKSKKSSELLEWAKSEQNPLGLASIEMLDGTMDVTRILPASGEFKWPSVPGTKIVFKLTAPGTLSETNATRRDGNTAVWEFDTKDVFNGKEVKLTARYKASTPWLTYLLFAMIVLCPVGFFVYMKRKTAY